MQAFVDTIFGTIYNKGGCMSQFDKLLMNLMSLNKNKRKEEDQNETSEPENS